MLERILNKQEVKSTKDALTEIKDSVLHKQVIAGLTHNLYKYPACFPPSFPRAVISSFSKVGDTILDPFLGGGTTAVEALVSRRHFVGSDINALAVFSAKLKTMLLTQKEIAELDKWLGEMDLQHTKELRRKNDDIFFTNVPKVIAVSSRRIACAIKDLSSPRLRTFAKGALLRVAQLEVENRVLADCIKRVEQAYKNQLETHIEKNIMLTATMHREPRSLMPVSRVFLGDATDSGIVDKWERTGERFNLVVTSPPYPERHILYHKWQVNGRTETRLPYWIIESEQLEDESFYTMGNRKNQGSLEIYISHMNSVFQNINAALRKHGVLIQVVAFTEPAIQLPLFLRTLNATGFLEIRNIDPSSFDGRLWRDVPYRKWWASVESRKKRCREVVLFHRKNRTV